MADEQTFATIPQALDALRAGRMIVVVDDEDRENEGDLTLAAEFATPEAINFMARFGRGLICLTLTEERADHLRLGPMTQSNTSRFGTAFTESIEAREGVTTGISAADRAHTIQVAISPGSVAEDLARPGHTFPLRARKGGVLVRAGQTEASVDLARMAGLIPAGVICEIMNDDGTMARVPDLRRFCAQHGLLMVTVADLIRYRLQHERYIHRAGETMLPTPFGQFRMIAYESEAGLGGSDATESHIALVFGDVGDPSVQPRPSADISRNSMKFDRESALRERLSTVAAVGEEAPALVRVHTHCLAGNIFGSASCDCRALVDHSLRMIAESGRGALLYLHNTHRGFTVDRSFDPAHLCIHRTARNAGASAHNAPVALRSGKADQHVLRQVGLGGQILSDLGLHRIKLLSNHPTHVPALQGFGIEIVERVPIDIGSREALSSENVALPLQDRELA